MSNIRDTQANGEHSLLIFKDGIWVSCARPLRPIGDTVKDEREARLINLMKEFKRVEL